MRFFFCCLTVFVACRPSTKPTLTPPPPPPLSELTASQKAALQALSPATLPAPPADISNRFADNAQAAALGQKLFFETRFSGVLSDGDDDGSAHTLGKRGDSNKVGCSGCHVPASGFVDSRTLGGQIALAAGWGRRRPPSLLDVGQATLLTWDGRRDAMYNQVFAPIESPVEYNSSRLYAARQLWTYYKDDYEALFGAMPDFTDTTRFPALDATTTGCQPKSVDVQPLCDGSKHGMPGDGAEFDGMASADQDAVSEVIVNMGKAIGAYERLLSCGPSRFDAWVNGNAQALSADEQAGALLFIGKAECVSCHSGPFMSDQQFHNLGLLPVVVAAAFIDSDDHGAIVGLQGAIDDPLNSKGKFSDGDDGRLPAAVSSTMESAFRTPILRCVSKRPSFMHTGQISTLTAVVQFLNKGGGTVGFTGTNALHALGLSTDEVSQLAAFLAALDGPGPAAALLAKPL